MTYTEKLADFKKYMNACFDVLMVYGNDDENESFYNSAFEIKFRGKTVKLENGADVFQAIEEIIDREIYENEGF